MSMAHEWLPPVDAPVNWPAGASTRPGRLCRLPFGGARVPVAGGDGLAAHSLRAGSAAHKRPITGWGKPRG